MTFLISYRAFLKISVQKIEHICKVFKNLNKKPVAWFLLIFLAVVWGSCFILIKKSLVVFDSNEVGSLKILVSFLLLLPFAIFRRRKLNKKSIFFISVVALIGSLAPAFLFAKAQTGIESHLAGILNSLTFLFTLLIGMFFFGVKTRWYNFIGIGIGFFGAAGLIGVSGGDGFHVNLSYAVYAIIATICYAINVNIVKRYLHDVDSLSITTFSVIVLGIPMAIYVFFFTDSPKQIINETGALEALGYVVLLAILKTGFAQVSFNHLIKISSPVFASSVTYLIPIVAIFWGVLDGEEFKLVYLVWIGMILCGVFLVNLKHPKKTFQFSHFKI